MTISELVEHEKAKHLERDRARLEKHGRHVHARQAEAERPPHWRDTSHRPKVKACYFALNPLTGFVKIGRSMDVRRRLATLDTLCGVELVLLGCDEYENEGELHREFRASRKLGEWFDPSGDGGRLGEYLLRAYGFGSDSLRQIVSNDTEGCQ